MLCFVDGDTRVEGVGCGVESAWTSINAFIIYMYVCIFLCNFPVRILEK